MATKNIIKKYLNKFRINRGYNYSSSKKENNSQVTKLVISIVLVIIIILLKMIDTDITNKGIQIIKDTINKNIDIEDGKKAIEYGKQIVKLPEKLTSSLKKSPSEVEAFKNMTGEYIFPVKGRIYQKFGEKKKANNITIFNKGIEILTEDEKVLAISDGTVIEIGKDNRFGNYIKIDHGDITAIYGRLYSVKAQVGTVVKKGDEIATLRGINSNRKIMYLQTIKDNIPINPLDIIDNMSINPK